MLEEAIAVFRLLWQGGYQDHRGRYFTVENARIYTLPDPLPEVMVAAAGPKSAELAGRRGDGLISTAPDADLVKAFEQAGGSGKPRFGQLTVCWAAGEAVAQRTAHEWWPNAAIPGELGQELPLPRHFEQAAQTVREEDVAKSVVCGPDPQKHSAEIRKFFDAGFDHVYIHQVGPDQEGFFGFYEREILPKLR